MLNRQGKTRRQAAIEKKLWMRLAEIQQESQPADVLSIYQPAIEPLINQSNNEAYANAVDLLLKVQSFMKRLDQQSDFDQFLGFLKPTHKRKHNFMSLLKSRGLVQ
ncbi:MAG: hypothetical protein AAF327_20690 [Cyanobacteria bacterium P01_A01_bin.37]